MFSKRCVAAVFAVGFVSTQMLISPAIAGIGVWCTALDGSKAEVFIALGGGIGFSALSANATNGRDLSYQTEEKPPKKGVKTFVLAQGMNLDDKLYADFSDTNLERILVSLRVRVDLVKGFNYKKSEEDEIFGSLTFVGKQPVPVSCTFG